MSAPEWHISEYAVGLLLETPDDIAESLMAVYSQAEQAARSIGFAGKQWSARAVHAVYVQHAANEARAADVWPEFADWLDRAARILITDVGLDLVALPAPQRGQQGSR